MLDPSHGHLRKKEPPVYKLASVFIGAAPFPD